MNQLSREDPVAANNQRDVRQGIANQSGLVTPNVGPQSSVWSDRGICGMPTSIPGCTNDNLKVALSQPARNGDGQGRLTHPADLKVPDA
ncbi:MAG: hypothetical protein HONBIEJF_00079 [Fimbriimonadaceae bacterium]|nr:hypothetical protein [Fimbriimonadaceae bacterium]